MIRSNKDWFKSAIVYQIYPRSFLDTTGSGVGDLCGIFQKLDYLKSLGVTDIWITPFFESPQKDNGYDVSDYYQIDPTFGSLEEFDRILSAAGDLGLGVIIDMVLNHTSDQHAWFLESRSCLNSSKRDWYHWRKGMRLPLDPNQLVMQTRQDPQAVSTLIDALRELKMLCDDNLVAGIPASLELFEQALMQSETDVGQIELASIYTHLRTLEKGSAPNNWESYFSGGTWTYDEHTAEWYFHLFSAYQPDLNWQNPAVRNALCDVMTFWAERGVTGFRLDAINFISKHPDFPDDKSDDPHLGQRYHIGRSEVHDYLNECYDKVFEPYNLMTIGECAHLSVEETLNFVGFDRQELTSALHFDLVSLDRGTDKYGPKSWCFADFKSVWSKWATALHSRGWMASYIGNHDQPRPVSRYIQPGFEAKGAKMLAGLLLTSPGTPIIYQGEEIAMSNVAWRSIDDYNDIECIGYYRKGLARGQSPEELLRDVNDKSRDNARTPMQWSTDRQGGFTTGKPWLPLNDNFEYINVAQQEECPDSVLNFYRQLTALRSNNRVLQIGKFRELKVNADGIYCYTITHDDVAFLVMLNLTAQSQSLNMTDELLTSYAGELMILSGEVNELDANQEHKVLSPYHFEVWKQNI